MEIKKIAKNTSYLFVPKVLKFFVGIIRAKLVAKFLGTEGMGIVSQLQNILRNISRFTIVGINDGLVKQISQNRSDHSNVIAIIKTYLLLISTLTIIVYITGSFFSKQISQYVFGSLDYLLYFRIGFAALPIMILSSSSFAVIKAYKQIKKLAIAELVIIATNFVIFIPLILFFKLTGAVIYVTLSFFVTFFVYRYISGKILKSNHIDIKSIIKSKPQGKYFKELISFMGAGLTAGIYLIFVDITTRGIVVSNLGIKKLGVYSPIVTWSGLFVSFIMPSVYTYLFPRIGEAKTNQEIVSVINDLLRLMTFIAIPFIVFAITTRNFLIPLFYSMEFIEATKYLPFHFIGLLLVIWCESLNQVYAPTGRLKLVIFITIFHSTLTLALVYFLIPRFGLYGWMARFTVTPLVLVLVHSIILKKAIGFELNRENGFLLLFSVIVSTIFLIFRDSWIVYPLFPMAILAEWFLLKKGEQSYILKFIRSKINILGMVNDDK